MPRLVNIGPGEIVDRLTILALKILYGSQQNREVRHFETERNALLVMLRGRELNAGWFEHALGLATVNGALWQAEDAMRDHRQQERDVEKIGDGDPMLRDISRVAFRIQELNDERARLVEAINKLTGDHLGSEKLT
jgi:hypothetical protein